jgi:hypothetical protein
MADSRTFLMGRATLRVMPVDPLADLTSNQNAPSADGADSDWLMGSTTEPASNQMPHLPMVLTLI